MKYRKLSELSKLDNNPRTIKREDLDKLKKSIADNPDYFEARPLILSNRTGKLVILGGNQRYEAAKSLGLDEVPTHLIEDLTEEREREIVIRDNVNNGEWDWDLLANDWDIKQLPEWGLKSLSQFAPTINPDAALLDTDADKINKEQAKLIKKVVGENQQQLSVLCPYCAEEFFVNE